MAEIENKKWFPLYTKSRFEKSAYDRLISRNYEAYLPLQKKLKQWSDRKKIVDIPLFSSYVFARVARHELIDVLKIEGITRYISFNGQPAAVRDEEISIIRRLLSSETKIDVIDGQSFIGNPVVITEGILAGYSGEIYQWKSPDKVSIKIESMNKSLIITLDKSNLKL